MRVLVERNADFAVGTSVIGRQPGSGSGDTLTIVLTDKNGVGHQYFTASTSGWSGWSGKLELDEVGATGGGVVRGSITASWVTMQAVSGSMPSGGPFARPGSLAVSFNVTRP